MAQVKIYNQETNSYYNVNFDLKQTILDDTSIGDLDYYITVSTTIPTITGGTFPTFRIRNMSDSPPGNRESTGLPFGTADDFNQLCAWYIEYFTVQAVLTNSSSSSSSLGESSSSSSSSYGKTSSSSSVGESSSSSSLGESSSSSVGESSSSSSSSS